MKKRTRRYTSKWAHVLDALDRGNDDAAIGHARRFCANRPAAFGNLLEEVLETGSVRPLVLRELARSRRAAERRRGAWLRPGQMEKAVAGIVQEAAQDWDRLLAGIRTRRGQEA